jgi:hypothetical protein
LENLRLKYSEILTKRSNFERYGPRSTQYDEKKDQEIGQKATNDIIHSELLGFEQTELSDKPRFLEPTASTRFDHRRISEDVDFPLDDVIQSINPGIISLEQPMQVKFDKKELAVHPIPINFIMPTPDESRDRLPDPETPAWGDDDEDADVDFQDIKF